MDNKPATRVEPAPEGGWNIIVNGVLYARHPHDASRTEATNWAFGDAWLTVVLKDGRSGLYSWSPDDRPIHVKGLGEFPPEEIAYFQEHA